MGASYSGSMVIGGEVKPGYETVEQMFRKNVATGREREAQLCVYVEGEKVVDLWGSAGGDHYLSMDPAIFAFPFFQLHLASAREAKTRAKRTAVQYPPDFEDTDTSLDTAGYISKVLNDHRWRAGESPGGSAHASARGLAKLAAAMANKGEFNGVRILSEDGWNNLHAGGIVRVDASMGVVRTEFTQGGVNLFNDYIDDNKNERILKSGRDGFVGWMGMGGSLMQWNPKLNIGFGYTCTLLTWWDLSNSKARKLQKEVVACARREKEISNESLNIT